MHTLAISVTNRCPLRCSFCCVPPGPGDIDFDIAESLIAEVISSQRFSHVGFTGGEPLLLPELVINLGSKLAKEGIPWGLTTGGGWATSFKKIDDTVYGLLGSGIAQITISIDESHMKWKSSNYIEYLVSKLHAEAIPIIISSTSNSESTFPINLPTSDRIKVEYHYIAPVGFAENLTQFTNTCINLRDSKCPQNGRFTLSVWPNGDVYPCCSTYIVNKNKGHIVGNVSSEGIVSILDRLLNDPFHVAINELGFASLIALFPEEVFWKDIFNTNCIDNCHLCHKMGLGNYADHIRVRLAEMIC